MTNDSEKKHDFLLENPLSVLNLFFLINYLTLSLGRMNFDEVSHNLTGILHV